jgi:alpha-ketoglutarate-dependent 2,4-dichlorophenoxyacetate dioxygenase
LSISIRQLRHGFEGEVTGVDCRKPLSSEEVTAIHAGMVEYAVLVFRDQKLSDEEQLQFTLQFGVLEQTRGGTPGPIHFRTEREVRKLGPSIKDFSNIDASGKPLSTDSRAYVFKLADQLWHSDSSFNAAPASYSLLSGRSVTSWGGNTEFADMRAAYDALPEDMKQRLRGLVAEHAIMHSRRKLGFDDFSDEENQTYPPVPQTLLRRHPGSGRMGLFLASHAGRIFGMPEDEGMALLQRLIEHATQRQFVYTHRWRLHDLVMWDNRCTMHRGKAYDDLRWPRDMQRATTSDVAPTCQQEGIAEPVAA